MAKIHVCDDNPVNLELLVKILKKDGHEVESSVCGRDCLDKDSQDFDITLLDLYLPDINGLDVLKEIRKRQWDAKVIMVTAESSKEVIQQAFAHGALNYLTKPLSPQKISVALKEALTPQEESQQVLLESQNPTMNDLLHQLEVLAKTNSSIVINGDSGTGKELIAQHIHQKSKFKDGPFIVVNCPAIPENLVESELFGHSKGAFTGATDNRMGKFEAANNGTIFLDEIADLPLGIQSKLLRVLQERTIEVVGSNKVKKINTRVICASHKDLKDEIAHGRFRLDLYYRLAEFDLKVPSLANRREDIPILARQFAKEICLEESRPILEFSPQLLDFLKGYEWPGNIRELKSLVRKLVILSQPGKGVIDAVPPNLLLSFSSQQDKEELKTAAVPGGKPTLKELEKAAIMTAIEEEKYNLSAVAKRLGIGRTTLYRKLKTHKIPYLRQPQQGNSPDKIGDIIDLDAYRQMQQLFGDQDDFEMKLVLNKFLALNQDYLSMIRQAANQQKLDLLINYSHELLDSCRSFGAKGVVEACENLNKVDSDTRLDLLFKLIQDLEEQIQIFTQFMEKRLA